MKAVIFDMDGVIIDSEPIHNRLMLATFSHFGIPFDPQDFNQYVGTSNSFLFTKLIKLHNLPLSLKEIETYHDRHLLKALKEEAIDPVCGIEPLLRELKARKIPAAIASSSPLALIKVIVAKFGFEEYFVDLISGEDLPQSKPDPAIYLRSAKNLGIDPADCLVIEDARNGVIAAKAAGMTCIGIINPTSGDQDLSQADRVVKTIASINLDEF